MVNKIAREDVKDLDIVDAVELAADGYTSYRTINLISTTASSKTIVISPASQLDILSDLVDEPVEAGDIVLVYDNEATGQYTIASIVDTTSFTVVESIIDSTDGYAIFMHASGASRVGFNSDGLDHVTADNVQEAIEQLDTAISGGGLTENQHDTLDQLVHMIAEDGYDVLTRDINGYVTNLTVWADSTLTLKIREQVITRSSVTGRVSQVVTIQYNAAGVEVQRITEQLHRDSNKKVGAITRIRS